MTEQATLHVAKAFYGKFKELRPIQISAMGPLNEGKNIVLSSGTGSGKTEAVVVPLLGRLWHKAVSEDKTVILYISPTKALINDLDARIGRVAESLGVRVGIRHGDRNDLLLTKKPHILITTPESLNVMMVKDISVLSDIEAVILDEVHLLYNTQRGLQLSLLLARLKKYLKRPIQWAALSATLGELPSVRDFFFGKNEPSEFSRFPATRSIDANIRLIGSDQELRELFSLLMDAPHRKILVFANSRRECESIAGILQKDTALSQTVMTHYSSMSREMREKNEAEFNRSPKAVCVATSTLEMGIDIGDIDLVVLFSPPSGISSFLQRIGRGNRRISKTNVLCMIKEQKRPVRKILIFATLVRLASQGVMPVKKPIRLYGAYAQQCLSFIHGNKGGFTRIRDICEALDSPHPMDRPTIESILAELESHCIVKRHGFKNMYGSTDDFWELADDFLLYGNFPISSQSIDLFDGKHLIGTIPRFNLLRLCHGCHLRMGGRKWQVVRIDGRVVEVKPSSANGDFVEIGYGGSGANGLDTFLANHLWYTLFAKEGIETLVQQKTWALLKPCLLKIREIAGVDNIPYIHTLRGIKIYTFAGTFFNKILSEKLGTSADADDISITCNKIPDFSSLPRKLEDYLPFVRKAFISTDEQTLFQQKLPQLLQIEEYLEEWMSDGDIVITIDRLTGSIPMDMKTDVFECISEEEKQ